jgi:Tat protein secretion system quality control protein TatD with DNase activity
MRSVGVIVLTAACVSVTALAQEVDLNKAVHCVTLSQQFGDSVKTAKAEDDVKTAATDLAKQGDQACMAHDYDAGMEQLRKALQQIGLKPIV